MHRLLAALAAALGLLAGCERASDTAAAPAATGSYELVRTSEFGLPALVGAQQACAIELTAGSLELTRTSEYRSRYAFQRRCGNAPPDTTFEHRAEGAYRMAGDTLLLLADDGSPDGSGLLRGDTLELAGPIQTLYYVRRDGPFPAVTPDSAPSP